LLDIGIHSGDLVKRLLQSSFAVVMVSALVSVLMSCAVSTPQGGTSGAGTSQTGDLDLVNRALAAMGGVDAMRALRSASIKGTVKHWEPEQSHIPGGEMRFAAESSFDMTLDFGNQRARTDWDKKFAYPAPRNFRYTEVVTPDAGFVLGIDSNGRNAQSLQMKPPAHTMSGVRLAASQRELRRSSPALLLEMRGNPSRVQRMSNVAVGNMSYPALSYNAGTYTFIVMFDSQSGLPARVRTLDFDNIWGDVNFDLVLADWQPLGNVRVAASQRYELNGRTVADIRLTQLTANPTLNPAGLSIPDNLRATAARPAVANVPYQWVIRRQFIGTYLDSDNTSYDTLANSGGLRLNELAPGVQHVVGGSHNALVVDMRDYLIVFDAPVSDWQSNWTIGAAQARYGAKQVRYLVLTHHHMDHAGGLRRYLAQGATLVVGRGTTAHYRRVLAAPATRNPDLAPYDFSKVNIIEVADKYVMNDGRREVSAHYTENPHVEGMLIGYVADARIGFVVDIWSPGAAPLPNQISSPLAAVVNATRRAGISPLRYAGGHGSTGEYAPLAGLAAQKP
jgi:glyoxylase-like metal-dependent hydrolase (beta-lactamase superfamily II)